MQVSWQPRLSYQFTMSTSPRFWSWLMQFGKLWLVNITFLTLEFSFPIPWSLCSPEPPTQIHLSRPLTLLFCYKFIHITHTEMKVHNTENWPNLVHRFCCNLQWTQNERVKVYYWFYKLGWENSLVHSSQWWWTIILTKNLTQIWINLVTCRPIPKIACKYFCVAFFSSSILSAQFWLSRTWSQISLRFNCQSVKKLISGQN